MTVSAHSRRDKVLVIGAGLAGLAAAERLLEAGLRVVVIDGFPVPGGRAASFEVHEPVAGLVAGDVVEHGLHAWFQSYHALFGLMARSGVAKPPFAGDGVCFWNPQHGHVAVEGGPLFWLIDAMSLPTSMRGPRREALGALLRLTAALHGSLASALATDEESACALLRRYGVPEPALAQVFGPCLYSLTSLRLEELSALEMLRWLSRILPDPRIRVIDGGATPGMCQPIVEALRTRGADFRFGVEVTRLDMQPDGRVRPTLAQAPDRTGVRHLLVPGFRPAEPPDPDAFDAVVSALPWERLWALSRHDPRLGSHPAIRRMTALRNVHPLTARLWFERPIEGARPRYILSSGTLFDVLRPTPEPGRQRGIRLIDLLVEDIDRHLPELCYDTESYVPAGPVRARVLARLLPDLERLYPGQIRGNRVTRCFMHSREGIIACRPGVWARRPPQFIGLGRFVLAGDWTRQPYGVCMEGAVRSGQLAARALLDGRAPTDEPWAFSQVVYSLRSLFERAHPTSAAGA